MDYFENTEKAPHAIQEIVKHHNFDDNSYENYIKLLDKLIPFDWGCDFNEKPFNLSPLNL